MHARTSLTCPTDLRAPGAIDDLLAFHHSIWGDSRMETEGGDTGTGTGASGTGDTGTGTGTAETATGTGGTGDTSGQGSGAGEAAKTWNPDAWDGKVDSLPDAAQKIITDLRKADGDERVAKKTLDAIQKALNPDSDEKVDPAKLAQLLADSQTTGKATAIELAVFKAAATAGADPAALTDSRTFMTKVAGLDPSADDFAAKVKTAIDEAVKNNPSLKAARAAGASSVNHAGGSGEGQHDLDAQIAEATKKGDHALAIRLKRQKAYTQPTT